MAKLLQTASKEDSEWEEVDEFSEEEVAEVQESPTLEELEEEVIEAQEEVLEEPPKEEVDIASRAKNNFLKKKLFSRLNYTCMPDIKTSKNPNAFIDISEMRASKFGLQNYFNDILPK